ncbi:MAG: hypothetical protein NVSMB46_06880 [Candidatus Saccharimonadales bacterium]
MNENNRGSSKRNGSQLGRKSKNAFVTKSGQTIKINRSLKDRFIARQERHSMKHAERLAGMPKGHIGRFFFRLHPKRLYKYWFSREGAITGLKIIGIGIIAAFIIIVGVFAYFRKDLPNITDVSGSNIGGSITYYDRTGTTVLWEDYDAVKRIPVSDQNINNYIKQATVAIEDKNFYKEGGFDVRGIARAGVNDFAGHGGTQGGSTITQQLVKLTQNWTNQRTVTRKVKELILAVELSREYSKQQILTGYLNVAPYGNIEYGVEAASNDYFHKSAKDLTLDEATFLAGIPKSPSVYSPYGPYFSKKDVLGRQQYILDQMVNQGMISSIQAEAAKKIDVVAKVQPQQAKYANIKAPYFVLAAKSELDGRYGTDTVKRGGWKVITTLNLDLQALAEKKVADDIPTIRRQGGDEAAFVAEDIKTGQIVTLVGGTDFNNTDHGKINYAHDAFIPPGSSFKPYDYVSLINNTTNSGAGSVLYDTQGALPGYPCTDKSLPAPKGTGNCLEDYDFHYPGPLTLRYALGGSRNVPAVKAMLAVGTDKVISTADAMMANPTKPNAYNCYADEALTKTAPCYGASAIGDGAFLHLDDHVNGIGTLARLGSAIPRTYIMKITDSANKTVLQWQQPKGNQVVRTGAAYIVNNMASDPNASYLPTSYKFQRYKGWNFAVKTGTTNSAYDGLMASWSTQYAALTWVGYHTRNKAMTSAMEYMTEPIVRGWMESAHDKLQTAPVNWQQPTDVKVAPAFVVHTHVGIGSIEPSPSTDLFPMWYQPTGKSTSTTQTIDTVSGKLATDCTPQLARKTLTTGNATSFSSDPFVSGGAQSVAITQPDDVHQCGDSKPSINLTATNSGNTYTFTATVNQGTHPLSSDQYPGTVNFIMDGQVLPGGSVNISSPGQVSISYVANFDGQKQVTAQIIDSVLYDSTSNPVTITGTVAQQPSANNGSATLVLNPPSISGNTASFNWPKQGSGTFTVTVHSTNKKPVSFNCSTGGQGCAITIPVAGDYSAVLTDDGGDQPSSAVTFTIP